MPVERAARRVGGSERVSLFFERRDRRLGFLRQFGVVYEEQLGVFGEEGVFEALRVERLGRFFGGLLSDGGRVVDRGEGGGVGISKRFGQRTFLDLRGENASRGDVNFALSVFVGGGGLGRKGLE